MIKHGYVLCTNFNAGHKYRILRKYFPNICKITMRNKTILYLEDKADVAARAFLANLDRKIMSFQELKQVTRTFGIDLSSKEKHQILGKTRKQKLPVIRRKDGAFLSGYHKNQSKIDDYIGEISFLVKIVRNVSRKIMFLKTGLSWKMMVPW